MLCHAYSHHVADIHAGTVLVQQLVCHYSRAMCSTLKKQFGRTEAAQALRLSPLRRCKQQVAKLVVCQAWIFVCDPLLKTLSDILQGEQG